MAALLKFERGALSRFAQGQGAIDKRETLLKHGKDPRVRAPAEEIITAQRQESADADGWLSSRR